MLFVEFVCIFVRIMFVGEVLYPCLPLDTRRLISVTSVERLELGVEVKTLSALSAIFASTTIVDLSLGVYGLKTVSKI